MVGLGLAACSPKSKRPPPEPAAAPREEPVLVAPVPAELQPADEAADTSELERTWEEEVLAIPECKEYVDKYRRCIEEHAPPDLREVMLEASKSDPWVWKSSLPPTRGDVARARRGATATKSDPVASEAVRRVPQPSPRSDVHRDLAAGASSPTGALRRVPLRAAAPGRPSIAAGPVLAISPRDPVNQRDGST
jgi:hypothetical protein